MFITIKLVDFNISLENQFEAFPCSNVFNQFCHKRKMGEVFFYAVFFFLKVFKHNIWISY